MFKNHLHILTIAVCVIAFSSCKSLQKLTSRDTSATTNSNATTSTRKTGDPKFIDGIDVHMGSTPGGKMPEGVKTKPEESKVIYAPPTDVVLTNFSVEQATALQFKYAILLDETIEKLTDINLLQNMEHWWGTHYCMGGSTENCIDCSAFTQIMMRDVYRLDVPRTAQEQFDNSNRVQVEDLEEGDLVFFQTSGRGISHVGIYITNNKFVHAATSNGVSISDLNDSYWRTRFKGAGRVGKAGDVAAK